MLSRPSSSSCHLFRFAVAPLVLVRGACGVLDAEAARRRALVSAIGMARTAADVAASCLSVPLGVILRHVSSVRARAQVQATRKQGPLEWRLFDQGRLHPALPQDHVFVRRCLQRLVPDKVVGRFRNPRSAALLRRAWTFLGRRSQSATPNLQHPSSQLHVAQALLSVRRDNTLRLASTSFMSQPLAVGHRDFASSLYL